MFDLNNEPKAFIKCREMDVKMFLTNIFTYLEGLQKLKIINGCLNTRSILVNEQSDKLKVTDHSSAFRLKTTISVFKITQTSMPEYLPPELLQYLFDNKDCDNPEISDVEPPEVQSWSIDMWSLACIIIEYLVGYPLHLPYGYQVEKRDGSLVKGYCGLFSIHNCIPP